MKTDLTMFDLKQDPDVICEFIDDNTVRCYCYLDLDKYCDALHKFIREHRNITVYAISFYFMTYTIIGPSDKKDGSTLVDKNIPHSFYDGKNVEIEIIR